MKRGNLRFDEATFAADAAKREAWKTGGNVSFDVPIQQPIDRPAGTPNTLYALVALCRLHRLPEPTPEYRFHPRRKWRFDYAWPLHMLALEIEGGVWRQGGGAHSHPLNIQRDMAKYSEAAVLGWKILRVAPEHLKSAGLDYIRRACGLGDERHR